MLSSERSLCAPFPPFHFPPSIALLQTAATGAEPFPRRLCRIMATKNPNSTCERGSAAAAAQPLLLLLATTLKY